jgi:hypothetical protein
MEKHNSSLHFFELEYYWWHNHKAQKEAAFLWYVIHNVVPVNKWREHILGEIDKSCPIVARL